MNGKGRWVVLNKCRSNNWIFNNIMELFSFLVEIVVKNYNARCLSQMFEKKFYSILKYFANRYKMEKGKNYQGKNFTL